MSSQPQLSNHAEQRRKYCVAAHGRLTKVTRKHLALQSSDWNARSTFCSYCVAFAQLLQSQIRLHLWRTVSPPGKNSMRDLFTVQVGVNGEAQTIFEGMAERKEISMGPSLV
jgi:hypothetical protein